MINSGSNRFEANAIFLQSTYMCAKSCPSCYVKEQESRYGSNHINNLIWQEVIDDILVWQKHIYTRQVTFALDTLNKSDLSKTILMLDIASMFTEALAIRSRSLEAHITVNHVNDLQEYVIGNDIKFQNINLLSISNINSVEEIRRARLLIPGAKINWNVMSGIFAGKETERIREILQSVDSAYVLLDKAPMGYVGHNFSDFFKSLNQLSNLKTPDSLPEYDIKGGQRGKYTEQYNSGISIIETDGQACKIPDLTSKINLDGCMNDAVQFSKTGYGCSSNVSRFQIWPDGRVTGCAYNSHNQYGKQAESFQDVISNLKDAKTRYEFNDCSIPKELKKFNSNKLKVLS